MWFLVSGVFKDMATCIVSLKLLACRGLINAYYYINILSNQSNFKLDWLDCNLKLHTQKNLKQLLNFHIVIPLNRYFIVSSINYLVL